MAFAVARRLARHPLLLLNALLLVAVIAAGVWRMTTPGHQPAPAPADLFMQSVASEDGDLGWRQLCPGLQDEVPRTALDQLTWQQRAAHAQQGVTLSIEHVSDQPQPAGGQVRTYMAVAHGADGSTGRRMYVLRTQANGCVEAVE